MKVRLESRSVSSALLTNWLKNLDFFSSAVYLGGVGGRGPAAGTGSPKKVRG